ncbi:MAG: class I SAM-dependent rRNA methyltransferase [Alphaproteobacteria bacterium]
MTYPAIKLQSQRHKRAASGHPWIFSNEIAMDEAAKALPPGSMAEFREANGKLIGVGSFHPHTLISGRIYERGDASIDRNWFAEKFRTALALRQKLYGDPFYRLIHAEADGLPGLIVDRYGRHVIVQLNIAGMDRAREDIIAALDDVIAPETIILRNDSGSRTLEGLSQEVVAAKGALPGRIELRENNLRFAADLSGGQKTGWFYDQRGNRALIAGFCRDARMLDVYCHTGGFAINAAAAGAAHVTGVDASELALDCAAEAAKLNGLDAKCSWRRGEAFAALADYAAAGEAFDVVVADPPAFIKNRKDIASGSRGYRKLARLAAALVTPGGFLFIASCSHHMELGNFIEQTASGLRDAGRTGQILQTVFAAADHPMHPHLPESAYLKGILFRIVS